MSGQITTSYPPVGAWFYPQPAWRGEARLHRVAGYRVEPEARELQVDADCGLSLGATTVVHVPDPADADLLCGRCRSAGPGPRPARRRRPRRRPTAPRGGEGS